jgi:hypothetical protein
MAARPHPWRNPFATRVRFEPLSGALPLYRELG